jgi:hypothetical protein
MANKEYRQTDMRKASRTAFLVETEMRRACG